MVGEYMSEPHVIETLDQLKALADPLRRKILSALCCTQATTRHIAEQLSTNPTRLYHHMDLLEKANLIEVVETRKKRGTIERYYRTTAAHFVVDQSLVHVAEGEDTTQSVKHAMLIDGLQASAAEARNLLDSDRQQAEANCSLLCRTRMRLSPDQAREFVATIGSWLDTCCDNESETDGLGEYALSIAFFPVRGDATVTESK